MSRTGRPSTINPHRTSLKNITWHPLPPILNTPRHKSNTGCTCIVGTPDTEDGWHLSISHPHRYPTWDELSSAREHFTPMDIEMAMVFPKPEEYANVHETCLHLWEARTVPRTATQAPVVEIIEGDVP